MVEAEFWRIIEEAGTPALCLSENQCERISDLLRGSTKQELADFSTLRSLMLQRSYTWPMLKACYIAVGYVSDDVFEDFQHWVILHGERLFYQTIASPDLIADYAAVTDPVEEMVGEPLLFVCENAWSGDPEDFECLVNYAVLPQIDTDWPSEEELKKQFPKLHAKFGNSAR